MASGAQLLLHRTHRHDAITLAFEAQTLRLLRLLTYIIKLLIENQVTRRILITSIQIIINMRKIGRIIHVNEYNLSTSMKSKMFLLFLLNFKHYESKLDALLNSFLQQSIFTC